MTKRRYEEAWTDKMKETLSNFLIEKPCPVCHGARLRPESLAFRVGNKNIAEISDMAVSDLLPFFDNLDLTEKEKSLRNRFFMRFITVLPF